MDRPSERSGRTFPHVPALAKVVKRAAAVVAAILGLISSGLAQSVQLYQTGWLTPVGGEVYLTHSNQGSQFIYSEYDAEVRRFSDSAKASPVASMWTLGDTLAIAVMSLDEYPTYRIYRFDDGYIIYTTHDLPVALSGDGKTLATTSNHTTVHVSRGGQILTIHLHAHILSMTLNGDGTYGVISMQDGNSVVVSIDGYGRLSVKPCSIKYGCPIPGAPWSKHTVAIFGSDTNDQTGLASIWLYNADTDKATNLHSDAIAVTPTSSGFLELKESGELREIDSAGERIHSFGVVRELQGYYYERGPVAVGFFTKGSLAPGDPTTMAFDHGRVYVLDQFGRFRYATLPWKVRRII